MDLTDFGPPPHIAHDQSLISSYFNNKKYLATYIPHGQRAIIEVTFNNIFINTEIIIADHIEIKLSAAFRTVYNLLFNRKFHWNYPAHTPDCKFVFDGYIVFSDANNSKSSFYFYIIDLRYYYYRPLSDMPFYKRYSRLDQMKLFVRNSLSTHLRFAEYYYFNNDLLSISLTNAYYGILLISDVSFLNKRHSLDWIHILYDDLLCFSK